MSANTPYGASRISQPDDDHRHLVHALEESHDRLAPLGADDCRRRAEEAHGDDQGQQIGAALRRGGERILRHEVDQRLHDAGHRGSGRAGRRRAAS